MLSQAPVLSAAVAGGFVPAGSGWAAAPLESTAAGLGAAAAGVWGVLRVCDGRHLNLAHLGRTEQHGDGQAGRHDQQQGLANRPAHQGPSRQA